MASSSPTIGYDTGVPYCATTTHRMEMTFEWAVQLKEYHEKLLVEIYRQESSTFIKAYIRRWKHQ